jgi:hypothetical protein
MKDKARQDLAMAQLDVYASGVCDLGKRVDPPALMGACFSLVLWEMLWGGLARENPQYIFWGLSEYV